MEQDTVLEEKDNSNQDFLSFIWLQDLWVAEYFLIFMVVIVRLC